MISRPRRSLPQDGKNWARIEGDHHTGALFDVGEVGEWDHLFIAHPQVSQPLLLLLLPMTLVLPLFIMLLILLLLLLMMMMIPSRRYLPSPPPTGPFCPA